MPVPGFAVAPEASTDQEVVGQVLAGNTALFELLMRRHNARIYRAARAIVRDEAEAEDVMQQAYLNAYKHLAQFTGAAQFSTWLTRIAVHEALARVKRQGRYEIVDVETALPGAESVSDRPEALDPERLASAGELRQLLETVIDLLPAGMREVFMLREVEGLSTAETAECLEVSDDVVKTRLSRARATLRHAILERTGATLPEVFQFYRPRCDRMVDAVLQQLPASR